MFSSSENNLKKSILGEYMLTNVTQTHRENHLNHLEACAAAATADAAVIGSSQTCLVTWS